MGHSQPPPKEPANSNEQAIFRTIAFFAGWALLFLALTEWGISGAKSPGSSDGYPSPDGNTQLILAGVGIVASLIAMGFAFHYAATGRGAKGFWILLLVAAAIGNAWMLFLHSCCGGLTV